MAMVDSEVRAVIGGVDTHKDLHVAAVVNEQDRVLGTRSDAFVEHYKHRRDTRICLLRHMPSCSNDNASKTDHPAKMLAHPQTSRVNINQQMSRSLR